MLFYKENEISEDLTCPYCKNKYNDPRMVECCSSFCMPCIDLLMNQVGTGFNCPVCDDFHEKPPKGYLKNSNLAKICEKQAKPLSRGSLATSLKSQLNELKLKLDELLADERLGIDKIKIHCDLLRNQVQLASEQAIETINSLNLELIDFINNYEEDSTEKYEAKAEHKQTFEKIVGDMYDSYSKWVDYLNQFKIQDQELKTASFEVNACLERADKERSRLMKRLFSGNILEFSKSSSTIDLSSIGELLETKSTTLFFNDQLDQLKVYNLAAKLTNYRTGVVANTLRVQFLTSSTFCVAYFQQNQPDKLKLAMLNTNLDTISSSMVHFVEFSQFKLAKLNNSIILCLINHPGLDRLCKIQKFSPYLMKQNEIEVGFEISSMCSFESNLYCLSRSLNTNTQIYVYDENLLQLMSVGQSDDVARPYFLSSSFTKMKVSERYYTFLDNRKIILVNRLNGVAEMWLDIGSNEFQLSDGEETSVLKYDKLNSSLVKYDLECRSEEMSLGGLDSGVAGSMELVDCDDGRLIFFSQSRLSLIF